MAEKSFSDTLNSIAGAWNPNIAQANIAEEQLELKRAQLSQSQQTADYNKVLKKVEIWDKADEQIAKGIADRSIDPATGEASRARIRAVKSEALARIGVQMPEFETNAQPDPVEQDTALGKATAYRDQLLARQQEAEAAGDGDALARLQQDIEAAEAAIQATGPKPTIIKDEVTGENIAVNPHTMEPIASFSVTPKPEPAGEKRSGTFKSVFKMVDGEEVFVGDFDSKNLALSRFEGSNQYRVYNTTSGGQTVTQTNLDGTSTITRIPPGQGGLSKPSRKIEEQTLIKLQERRAKLEKIAADFKPEYLQWSTQLWNAALDFADKSPFGMPESEKENFRKSKNFVRNAISQMNDYIKEMTGAAMGEAEAVRLRNAIADAEKDGPTAFLGKLKDTLAETKFAELRSWRRLHKGIDAPITDAETEARGMSLGDPASEDFGKGGEIGALLNSAAAAKEKEMIELLGKKPVGQAAIEFRKDVMRNVLLQTFKVPIEEIPRYVR